ncbi:MAG: alpha/beta hydrolase [Verrucomicrobiota bacterium]
MQKWMIALAVGLGFVCVVTFITAYITLPQWGVPALLQPYRKPLPEKPAIATEIEWKNSDVVIRGWLFPSQAKQKATLIYLHGVADNRAGVIGLAKHFCPLGFDVIAYDSRAHGTSGGTACTYGFHEHEDLKIIIESIDHGPVILCGSSMGAAVALLTAEHHPDIRALVLLEIFADLRSAIRSRVPSFIGDHFINVIVDEAEKAALFDIDQVSPLRAAENVSIPTLLIHGTEDKATPPDHSRKVYLALQGEKELILIEGAGHSQIGSYDQTWEAIEKWVLNAISSAKSMSSPGS